MARGGGNNRARLDSGFQELRKGLSPFVERQMASFHGRDWRPKWEAAESARLNAPRTANLQDPRFLLKVIRYDQAFKSVVPYQKRTIAEELVKVRDDLYHVVDEGAIDGAAAERSLRNMIELLQLAGAGPQAKAVTQLLNGNGTATSRPAPPPTARKQQKAKPKPRKPQPRPAKVTAPQRGMSGALLGKLGCLAVVLVAGGSLLTFLIMRSSHDARNDPYQGSYTGVQLGGQLGAEHGIDLSDGFHLNLLDDPHHPARGGSGGDLAYESGTLTATDQRIALLTPKQKAGYPTCRDDTRYTASLDAGALGKGSRFCVTTDLGVVALVTVRAHHDTPTRYVTLDLTTWKGPKPA